MTLFSAVGPVRRLLDFYTYIRKRNVDRRNRFFQLSHFFLRCFNRRLQFGDPI